MADSKSFVGARPVAAMAFCCEDFQSLFAAIPVPFASNKPSCGLPSGFAIPAVASDGPMARKTTRAEWWPVTRERDADPAKAAAVIRRVITEHQVNAVVGGVSLIGQVTKPYATKARIPPSVSAP